MKNQFVTVKLDLFSKWDKEPPVYRIYVNSELFAERTYIWGGTQFLQEVLQLNAPPGQYVIRVDNLGDPECQFKIRNLTGEIGPVRILDSKTFEITNESA